MSKRKNNILKLGSFLIIFFIIFLGSWTISRAAHCEKESGGSCHGINSQGACDSSANRCTWYTMYSECCEGLETDWPAAPGGIDLTGESALPEFVAYVFRWGVLLAGLAAFFMLVFGGFKYLTSVGDSMKMNEARERIISAILGLVLVLSSFLILTFLNPELTVLNLPSRTPQGFSPGSFSEGTTKAPCKEIQFFNYPNWNTLFAAYFKDEKNWSCDDHPDPDHPGVDCMIDCSDYTGPGLPVAGVNCMLPKCMDIGPCEVGGLCGWPFHDPCCIGTAGVNCIAELTTDGYCHRVGNTGWCPWGFCIGAVNTPLGSIKMVGACVLTAYIDNDCKESPSNLTGNNPDITDIFSGTHNSLKVYDRTPPEKPTVAYNTVDTINLAPLLLNPQYAFFNGTDTCQVDLHGILEKTGNSAYVKISLKLGLEKDRMLDFPPSNDNWKVPDVIPLGLNPEYWNTKEGLRIKSPISDPPPGRKFTHVVTGLKLKASAATTYYWTVQACSTDGGLCSIAGNPGENYATFTINVIDMGGGVKICDGEFGPIP